MSLLELTAVELAKEIKAGKTTAVEAMKAVLEQIEKTEETYHCYITIDKEKAMQAAKEAQEKIEAGTLTGPLAGVPVAIKDNLCTKGVVTTCASKILENFVPQYDAEAVVKLQEDGAVVIDIGQTNIDGKLYGDVDFENVSKKASYITKAVGGVGPMTVAMLMTNLVDCAEHELNARNARLTNC